jgi:amino acid adenylation domain-containing protein
MDRSADAVLGYLAAMRAGAAYVPLDPDYAPAVLDQMLASCEPRVVLAADPRQADALGPALAETDPADVAYAVFTSGSTGRPKCIEVPHRAATGVLDGIDERMSPPDPLVGAWWTSPAFDVAVWEIWSVLGRGGTLCVPGADVRLDGDQYAAWLRTNEVTSAYVAPAHLEQLRDAIRTDSAGWSLRRLLVGVEPIALGLLQDLRRGLPALRILNGYGPAETTVCATLYEVPADGGEPAARTPIGSAVAGANLVVAPNGELFVGGAGVAYGYRGQPAMTADRFRPAPGGGRLYATGDHVRHNEAGDLIFVGRADRQLKVNGYRIEPEAVERVLLDCPGVREAVVEPYTSGTGAAQLAAFVTGVDLIGSAVREHTVALLPAYAVPAVVHVLADLPQTANGKFDRAALVRLATTRPDEPTYADGGPVLKAILESCVGVLPTAPDPSQSLRTLGGSSLDAVRVASRLRTEHGIELPASRLLSGEPLAVLAQLAASSVDDRPPAWLGRTSGPLHPVQLGIWLDATDTDPLRYVEVLRLRLTGPVDVDRLCSAISAAVDRHPVAAAAIVTEHGVPRLHLGRHPVPIGLGGSTDEDLRPFRLDREAPLRVRVLRRDTESVLQLTWHHLAVDTWSTRLFLDSAGRAYRGEPEPAPQPPTYCDLAAAATLQARDHVVRRRAGAVAETLAGSARVPLIDGPPRARRHRFGMDEADAIATGARRAGVSTATAWLALAWRALAEVTATPRLLMGLAWHGRGAAGTDKVVGCMVNPLLVSGPSLPAGDWDDELRSAAAELDRARANVDLPFAAVAGHWVRSVGGSPIRFPNVFVGYDEAPALNLGDGVRSVVDPVVLPRAKYEYSVAFENDTPHGVWCMVECIAASEHDDPTIGLLAAIEDQIRRAVAVTA